MGIREWRLERAYRVAIAARVRTAGVRVSGRARKAMGPRQKRVNQRQASSDERGAEAEDGEEIFRHDVDDAHGSDGPVKSNHAGGDGYALAEAGLLDAAGEGEVFEDLHAEGVEAAELLVGGGAEEVEGSDADGVADGFGVGRRAMGGWPRGP